MYISIEQSRIVDRVIKDSEVALRGFVSEVLCSAYPVHDDFLKALRSISISEELIYSKRFNVKLKGYVSRSREVYSLIVESKRTLEARCFNGDVPYVSELIDLLLILFNAHFADKELVKNFSSVEEFHFCCAIYHQTRNYLSHPASKPVSIQDANKALYFIENIIAALDDKYFWYSSRESIRVGIKQYLSSEDVVKLKFQNLKFATSTHKSLLCRDAIVDRLYASLLGNDVRYRLAGSVVLYGYGGVGKTAITTEFLYRLVRDKKDGKYPDLNYLLFFSSKDEYLRENKSTGELYIDMARPEFSNFEELKQLICSALKIDDVASISEDLGRGIIAIDNIENIEEGEKSKILEFIRFLPRSVQFIVTSRNEEACEEKIHVEEFRNDDTGVQFVQEIVESEGFNLDVNRKMAERLLFTTKGNALIIVQALNIIDRGVSTFDQITASLESMRSRNSEMIASFMYKNTFDGALKYLRESAFPVDEIMRIISLYDERIELYSISRLADLDVYEAEKFCNYLLERLILKKVGEYYELNEFAKRFVFIKMLPDKIELGKVRDRIKAHKERMNKKLHELEVALGSNTILAKNVNEWQPRNYIDKIVIAELFSLYGEGVKALARKNKFAYEKYLKEFDEHFFITKHPYIPLQKARLLKEGMKRFYRNDNSIATQVEHLYEEAIESIEFDYRYLIGGAAHASLLMFFGVFLCQHLKQYSRAIRFLEDAKEYYGSEKEKGWFTVCNYLSIAYRGMLISTRDEAYSVKLRSVVREVAAFDSFDGFDIPRFKKEFVRYIN
ncbi:TPA: ATP-binding protein [Pseudomonas aeruginosa]|uniref:ATP-binding protein n=1 Tax=Pseudomonas aeruginosa TaxID=287 RepID=UPI0013C51898|nr:ATP-binding protein [Pseudomonas aeruginosa]MBI8226670.1 ATP-binding protein [Pseudomonas aeruginosa]MCZ9685264.1 ATP-binding protein [Pseudomonas aeruginosa]MDP5705288.1 ATP-binding protein [Pseudomonas aeruginosa]WHV95520.1 ATP-binding protein [Pseudomonas aeruginosa]HBN7643440.1 ATP-binding protein [Pseudomonas aeruginosa]